MFEPTALDELFPDWSERGAPLHTPVQQDRMYFLPGPRGRVPIPGPFVPHTMHNRGNYIISLGELCRWLAERAEELGVDVFPGFPAARILYGEDGAVAGVQTQDMGLDRDGTQKEGFTPGMELRARYTLFAEGCRGHLGKELVRHFALDADRDPQHYGIGIKELWEIDEKLHQPGTVIHSFGWPLSQNGASGGGFLYHGQERQVSLGLITDLNYRNPHLNPYEEFQRFKHHPLISRFLENGKRLAYGARALTKGGPQSLPKMSFPGGLLLGCDAGTLNYAKIKGSHTAMKSGMVAAEQVYTALQGTDAPPELGDFDDAFAASWAGQELRRQRNFGPAQHLLGGLAGAAYSFVDISILRGRAPWTLRDKRADHEQLHPAAECKRIEYPRPDGKISFDKLSSVYLSNTNHEENQPCHLQLQDPGIPIAKNLPLYDEPAQRYCPAGVYEVVQEEGEPRFQINAQNCVHCKTCDIKDPGQNIHWVTPEGGGGPNYPNL